MIFSLCRSRQGRGKLGSQQTQMNSQDDRAKLCRDCGTTKPLRDFHLCRSAADRTQRYCKACQNIRMRGHRTTRNEGSSTSSEGGEEETPEAIGEQGEPDLYVMTNPRIPGKYKVGRSRSIFQRRAKLQASQNFKMKVVATIPTAGWAEGLMLDRLAHTRVREGAGRE